MRRWPLWLAVALLVAPVRASAADGLTFSEALRLAAEKSPSAIMAGERVRQALEHLSEARSFLWPHVDGTLSENRQTRNLATFGIPLSPTAPALTPPFDVMDARVKLTQTLFDAAAFKRLESAAIGRELSAAEAKKAKADAMALVGTLYIEARRAEDSMRLNEAALRLESRRCRLAKQRLTLGTGSELELTSARTALSDARYAWRTARTHLISKRLDLKAALGWKADEPLVLADESPVMHEALPKTSEINSSVAAHPDVVVASEQAKLSRSSESADWAEFLPKISAVADYGPNGQRWSDAENTYLFGVQVTMPFFDGFERWAAAAEARSKAREAGIAAADVERKQRAAADEARNLLKDARRLLVARQDRFIESALRKRVADARAADGTGSRLDALAADTETVRALDDRGEAVALYRTAAMNLAHALGRMDKLLEKGSVA